MPKENEDELEPLGFLEKSHCVPILIALDKNGMMNRNQVYNELGETIRVVIKRIELLKQYDLIYEIEMIVKPFAKYINLTRKGKIVASHLSHIDEEMKVDYDYPVSLFEFDFSPKTQKDGERVARLHTIPISNESLERELNELTTCPNCSNRIHAVKEGKKSDWKCFYCGFIKEASYEELLHLWSLEVIFKGLTSSSD